MPGVDKKDVKVNIDGDVLSLSVESKKSKDEEKEQNGVKYHRWVAIADSSVMSPSFSRKRDDDLARTCCACVKTFC